MYAAVQAMFAEMSFAEDFPGAARLGIVILSFNLYHDFFSQKLCIKVLPNVLYT